MKTKYFITGYFIMLIFSVFVRMVQIFNYSNQYTGFFYTKSSVFFSVLVVVAAILLSATSLYVKRCPLKLPKITYPLSAASFLVAVSMFANAFSIYHKSGLNYGFTTVLDCLINIVCGVFFLLYASKKFIHFHIKRILYVIPLIYWLIYLVEAYIRISRMALIFENGIMIASTGLICIFMLYLAKYANNIPSGSNAYKAVLFFGSLSSMSCIVFSVPQIYAIMNGTQKILHNDLCSIFTFLTTGIFIQIFTLTFFSSKNLFKKRHRTAGSDKILPTDF